jgi:hypothetical protein
MEPAWSQDLTTRDQFQDALRKLAEPLRACRSPGHARVRLGATGAHYSVDCAEMEGFCRPLWGLAPLAAGGGHYDDWDSVCRGLVNGTNPAHPEFWGLPGDYGQRLVEMAALGAALCLAPHLLWEPLAPAERTQVAAYLEAINTCRLHECNWYFFRVLVNLALHRVGARSNPERTTADLDRLESYYLGDGWYSDGLTEQRDYYVSFAMHYYGLLYALLAQQQDPRRCERFRERAARFARDFILWFAADGSALPFGRSLTYRFAQGAFWGALAFAGVEALPWGVIKGLFARHLRWWLRQPIFTETGLLTIGYSYPNLNMAEQYNSPGSPYWAFKLFLPLALPESHPFWSATEQALPDLPRQSQQSHARMLICRDDQADHVVALVGGQWAAWGCRHGSEKYAKFCYANRFGFSVPSAATGLEFGAHDSMLALSEEGEYFRVRGKSENIHVSEQAIRSTWSPWPDVLITTWLVPTGAWHVRVHHVRSKRALVSAEGGFALSRAADDRHGPQGNQRCTEGHALAEYPAGLSSIRDLLGNRAGQVVRAAPNTNLLHPRTVIPTLRGRHEPGQFWLACAVQGLPRAQGGAVVEGSVPTCALTKRGFTVAQGDEIHYHCDAD